ncbi:MAG: type II secretion system protein [Candidatus Pacebacteria bacterium]|nr:type II secretion system protein [Candidatus Paceibacterota bacterium]
MKKGFTLLELLIVIGILAILATVLIAVINPAELLRRARDTQRLSDLDALRSAISLFIVDMPSADTLMGDSGKVYSHISGGVGACMGRIATTKPDRTTDGSGWIPINFNNMSTKSPLAALPVDPSPATSGASRYYLYLPNTSDVTFELTANMESGYYKQGGSMDKESTDGGKITTIYETGTKFIIDNVANCYATP